MVQNKKRIVKPLAKALMVLTPVAACLASKGIVNIHINDFRKQLTTMKAIGASNKLEELKTLAKFGRFFMGALNEIYGGVFARLSAFNPDAPPRPP